MVYVAPDTGEELKFYCDDIAGGIVFVIDVHDA